jgi:erythromycin esterase-like protein
VNDVQAGARSAWRISGAADDYGPLLERTKHARFVLLGEASHGTHEFYRERAEITKRLIAEQGCIAVAAEADWPDAYRVNRFVRGSSDDATAEEALADFRRFPSWMWRNTDVLECVRWLREWNDALPEGAPKVGFYGLDLYSLHTSMEAVMAYLDDVDPDAARRARQRYACFDHFGRDPDLYAYSTGSGRAESCEDDVVAALWSSDVSPLEWRAPTAASAMRASSPSKTRGSWSTPSATTAPSFAEGRRPGTCATGTWPTRSTS